jgi:peptidoglycan/LPS O-acetylase OafA/YrhL
MTKRASAVPGQGIRSNNLDTLRLLLASLVVLEHANNLFHVSLGTSERFGFFLLNLSDIAVSAFFVISGMLTYISFARDPDVMRFYLRRFFRVFPAYWSVIVAQIVVFGLLATTLVNWQVLPFYTLVNLATANFLQPSFVEGISALNGALWTIKIEASYYLFLPLLFPLLVRRPTLLVLAILSLLWAISFPYEVLAKQLPGKIYLFAAGVALARVSIYLTPRHSLWAMLLLPFAIGAKFATEIPGLWERWLKRPPVSSLWWLSFVNGSLMK